MTKFTLSLPSLFILTCFSTASLANSPWAEEETTATDTASEEITSPGMEQSGVPMPVENAIEEDLAVENSPVQITEKTETTESIDIQQGDIVNVNPPQANVQILNFPRRGMSTSKVENELGRPNEIIPAVGTPPISRWIYDDRTIYFERSSVIHVVAK